MKKDVLADPKKTKEKGVFYQAGEIIGSIGFHIVDRRDKLAGAVSEEFGVVRNAIKKLTKKKTSESKTKKPSKKKPGRKVSGKSTEEAKQPKKRTKSGKAVKNKAGRVKKIVQAH